MASESTLDPGTPATAGRSSRFSSRAIEIGFYTGLLLAVACLILSAFYLVSFQRGAAAVVDDALRVTAGSEATPNSIYGMQFLLSVHMYIARIQLLSCGVFAGLAFGFLGFSLFLIGVEGSVDAGVQGAAGFNVSLARIAPGALVMICAAALIGFCARASLPANVQASGVVTSAPSGSGESAPAAEEADPDNSIERIDSRPPSPEEGK